MISSPQETLNVFDFEAAMQKAVPPAHYGYMATGTNSEATLRANREGFRKFQLRPRRLVDVGTLDLRMELFGRTSASPIVIARTGNHLQMLSTVAAVSIEDAMAVRGQPIWFQLHPTNKWEIGDALARRAEKAGVETIVVTVDLLA